MRLEVTFSWEAFNQQAVQSRKEDLIRTRMRRTHRARAEHTALTTSRVAYSCSKSMMDIKIGSEWLLLRVDCFVKCWIQHSICFCLFLYFLLSILSPILTSVKNGERWLRSSLVRIKGRPFLRNKNSPNDVWKFLNQRLNVTSETSRLRSDVCISWWEFASDVVYQLRTFTNHQCKDR